MRTRAASLLLLGTLVACEPPGPTASPTPPREAPPAAVVESAKPASPPPSASAIAADAPVDADALKFFNELSGSLRIELTEPAGVDVHHTFFEGMSYVPDKRAWSIHWGS